MYNQKSFALDKDALEAGIHALDLHPSDPSLLDPMNPQNRSLPEILRTWLTTKSSNTAYREDCVIMPNGRSAKKPVLDELWFAVKLAFIAYACPLFMREIAQNLHQRNHHLTLYMQGVVVQEALRARAHMVQVVRGVPGADLVILNDDNQLAGFYLRTKVRMWDDDGHPTVAAFVDREALRRKVVVGNNNVHVLRHNLRGNEFELFVLFRGVSSDFHGAFHFGAGLKNTQVFRVPEVNLVTQVIRPGGSCVEPLFHFYYALAILDVRLQVYRLLDTLGASGATRILVCGHSMGGGLTTAFAFLCRKERPDLWEKCQFRAVAAPMCCNKVAVTELEDWVQKSNDKMKFLQVINSDDFVNMHHKLAGVDGVNHALRSGASSFVTWALDQHRNIMLHRGKGGLMKNAETLIQMYPEGAAASFVRGVNDSQSKEPDTIASAAVRMRGTALILCKRRMQWRNEYFGRGHMIYLDINMNVLHAHLRSFEDEVFQRFAQKGLLRHNETRLVAMFAKQDQANVGRIVENLKSDRGLNLWEPSRDLILGVMSMLDTIHPASC